MLVPYHRYVSFLKWLTLSLLAYALVLFTVHVPWGEVALRTVWPNFTLNSNAAAMVVAIFGTTISPYLSSGKHRKKSRICGQTAAASALARCCRRPQRTQPHPVGHVERHVLFQCSRLFHYPDDGVTLHVAGITDINTAAQAATALRPLAGSSPTSSLPWAFSASG